MSESENNDPSAILFEIEKIEQRLKSDKSNLIFLTEITNLCVRADKKEKGYLYAEKGLESFVNSPLSGETY
jgi:hypothetical protein